MSTAQSPRPDDTNHPPGPAALKGESPWARMLLIALVVGALFWSVTALLSPDDGTLRQFAAAVLCAGAALLVQYVIGLTPARGTPGWRSTPAGWRARWPRTPPPSGRA